MHNHPRKTRSAMHGYCAWQDLVKNLGDYESENRRGTPPTYTAELTIIYHTYPYLPKSIKVKIFKNKTQKKSHKSSVQKTL
jgi:hypothetical protein